VGPVEPEIVRIEAPAMEEKDPVDLVMQIELELPIFREGGPGPVADGGIRQEDAQFDPGAAGSFFGHKSGDFSAARPGRFPGGWGG
jgi:hypothetical protein